MTKDMQPHQLGSFGAHIAEAIANKIADERDHWKAQADCEMKRADTAEDALSEMRARAECAEAELAAVRDAAHVPDDWPHGLPSWVNQRLYAAYIGAAFSPQVLEQIRTGRLAFPEAPIYAEAAALRAELAAAVREVEGIFDSAAETELRLNATIDALRAERDAARGYEIHAITGSTSAGRRQRDAGKARRSDEDQL